MSNKEPKTLAEVDMSTPRLTQVTETTYRAQVQHVSLREGETYSPWFLHQDGDESFATEEEAREFLRVFLQQYSGEYAGQVLKVTSTYEVL